MLFIVDHAITRAPEREKRWVYVRVCVCYTERKKRERCAVCIIIQVTTTCTSLGKDEAIGGSRNNWIVTYRSERD